MTPAELTAELARIKTLPGAEALALVKSLVADVAERVTLLIAAWKRAEEQGCGEELASIRHGIFRFIPKATAGTLLPQMIAMFGGAIFILSRVAELDLTTQRDIAEGKRFPFVVRRGDTFDTINVSVPSLNQDQARQLFGTGTIRDVADQRFYLESHAATPVLKQSSVTLGKVIVDAKTQTVRIGRSSSPAVDVIKALAAAGLIEPPKKQK